MYRRIDRVPRSGRYSSTSNGEIDTFVGATAQKQMSGRHSEIWLSFSVVCLPMLMFSALLLGLVYKYRVTHGVATNDNLHMPAMIDEPGIYYVDLSATVLIFVASWSSSLGPLLAGFVMSLASYPLSKRFWNDVQQQEANLPTPFQFALTLKFITSGGWGALYTWIKYLVGWKKQRQLQSNLLTASACVTVIATTMG